MSQAYARSRLDSAVRRVSLRRNGLWENDTGYRFGAVAHHEEVLQLITSIHKANMVDGIASGDSSETKTTLLVVPPHLVIHWYVRAPLQAKHRLLTNWQEKTNS